jgi:hypothetical protein
MYVFLFRSIGPDQQWCPLIHYTMSWEDYLYWGKAAERNADPSRPQTSGVVAPLLHMASCSEQGQNKLSF